MPRKYDWTTNREPKLVARERWNTPWTGEAAAVKEVACIQRGIAEEFERRTVKPGSAGLSDDLRKARGAVADLGGHDAGTGTDFLNSVHVEVGERRSTHFRVRGIDAVRGEDRGGSPLAIYGELLGEIRGAVRVGHRASGKQDELAEIPLVERQARDFPAGEPLATAGLRLGDILRCGFFGRRAALQGGICSACAVAWSPSLHRRESSLTRRRALPRSSNRASCSTTPRGGSSRRHWDARPEVTEKDQVPMVSREFQPRCKVVALPNNQRGLARYLMPAKLDGNHILPRWQRGKLELPAGIRHGHDLATPIDFTQADQSACHRVSRRVA